MPNEHQGSVSRDCDIVQGAEATRMYRIQAIFRVLFHISAKPIQVGVVSVLWPELMTASNHLFPSSGLIHTPAPILIWTTFKVLNPNISGYLTPVFNLSPKFPILKLSLMSWGFLARPKLLKQHKCIIAYQ